MRIVAGSHRFDTVAYDPERDLMELTTAGRRGIENGRTPEGDLWFVAKEGSKQVTGLRVREPGRRQWKHGAITVTMPDGARAELRGARRALTAWRGPTRGPLWRQPLRR
jgi:hypothetical protein